MAPLFGENYYADNEILVVASEAADFSDIKKLAASYDGEIVGYIEATGDYQISLKKTYSYEELKSLKSDLEESEFVDLASLNLFTPAGETANETVTHRNEFYYGSEYVEDMQNFNDMKGKSWHLEAINMIGAWDILHSHTINPVKVGVIDDGFDTDHEDLSHQFSQTFYNTKEKNHGTHVAGILAADTGNETGIAGVYPYGRGNLNAVSLPGIERYKENTNISISSVGLKIAYGELILRNVKVINTSLAFNYCNWDPALSYTDPLWTKQTDFLEENSYILGDFLDRLLKKGYDFVLVTGAGNDSKRKEQIIYDSTYLFWTTVIKQEEYPEVYDRILVIGAVDKNLNIWDNSNGGDRVDLFAPGIIWSAVTDGYKEMQGTSMATPVVSGVAAMVWSLNDQLSGSQVKKILCKRGSSRCTSCKMVDAYLSLQAALNEDKEEETSVQKEPEPEYGSIMGFCVGADNEERFLPDIRVTAVNLETGNKETMDTDKDGHFELILPEGDYQLSAQSRYYMEYQYPDTIHVEKKQVHYLDSFLPMVSTYYVDLKRVQIQKLGLADAQTLKERVTQDTAYPYPMPDTMWYTRNGIISAGVWDLNRDGIEEFLVYYFGSSKSERFLKEDDLTYSDGPVPNGVFLNVYTRDESDAPKFLQKLCLGTYAYNGYNDLSMGMVSIFDEEEEVYTEIYNTWKEYLYVEAYSETYFSSGFSASYKFFTVDENLMLKPVWNVCKSDGGSSAIAYSTLEFLPGGEIQKDIWWADSEYRSWYPDADILLEPETSAYNVFVFALTRIGMPLPLEDAYIDERFAYPRYIGSDYDYERMNPHTEQKGPFVHPHLETKTSGTREGSSYNVRNMESVVTDRTNLREILARIP